eukprot:TRINITY_DN32820_c0_g1_i2.p1 TRINITY_DN32820_c0_g1~~TRINITY_DN32820_c0_g1_i2.p1  ORF type:complete len:278 (+),score=80.18 TRINITY_DN32820_c0_g1_i2:68-835(+)
MQGQAISGLRQLWFQGDGDSTRIVLPVVGSGGGARLRVCDDAFYVTIPAEITADAPTPPATAARNATDLSLSSAPDTEVLCVPLSRIRGVWREGEGSELRVQVGRGAGGSRFLVHQNGIVGAAFGGKWGCNAAERAIAAAARINPDAARGQQPEQKQVLPLRASAADLAAAAAVAAGPAPSQPSPVLAREAAELFDAIRADLAAETVRQLDEARTLGALDPERREALCAAAFAFAEREAAAVDAVERALLGSRAP